MPNETIYGVESQLFSGLQILNYEKGKRKLTLFPTQGNLSEEHILGHGFHENLIVLKEEDN
jgi:hypothetical protein